MKLWNKKIGKNIILVAEIGVNHEGSIKRAIKLIRQAKIGGADAIKLQLFTPDKYVSSENLKRLNIIKKYYLDEKKIKKLIKYCKKININYFFTPVTEDWINFAAKNSEVIKIASGDLRSKYLIKRIAKKNKKIILSTGLSNTNDVKKTIKLIKKYKKKDLKKYLLLLHCVSEYPVPNERAQLNSISYLKDNFKFHIGYSNHVKESYTACIAAIALGAKLIEFHFTDNKKRKFRDHHLSINLSDLRKLRRNADVIKNMLGEYYKKPNYFEKKNKVIFEKGLIASKDISKGENLTSINIGYARSALYFHCNDIKKILNKKAKHQIKAGSLIKKENLI